MCSVFENATFNKVFKNSDFNINKILYASLKEDTPREKLIKFRLMNGLTQKEMARRLGVGFSTLCKCEEGLPNISEKYIKSKFLHIFSKKL